MEEIDIFLRDSAQQIEMLHEKLQHMRAESAIRQGLVITEATKMQDVAAYLTANCPGLCPALRWLLSLGAA